MVYEVITGCISDGKDYEEAIKNIEIIISEWIETAKEIGKEIPKPVGRKLVYA